MSTRFIRTKGAGRSTGPGPQADAKQAGARACYGKIRKLLRDGQVHDARQLAAVARKTHPDHSGIRRLHDLLSAGRSERQPASGRSARAELDWLRDPPEEYHGKWIAVVGRTVVAAADSLRELVKGLPQDLDDTPLAVQIDS